MTPEAQSAVLVLENTLMVLWALAEEDAEAIPARLRQSYFAALEALDPHYEQAIQTLQGRNRSWPRDRLRRRLLDVGWYGAQLDFKLATLGAVGLDDFGDEGWAQHRTIAQADHPSSTSEHARSPMRLRSESAGKGGLAKRVAAKLLPAVNSALDSLADLPGVHAIKEVKGFAESATSLDG